MNIVHVCMVAYFLTTFSISYLPGDQEAPKAPLGFNFRPIQSLNDRVVRTSIEFRSYEKVYTVRGNQISDCSFAHQKGSLLALNWVFISIITGSYKQHGRLGASLALLGKGHPREQRTGR